MKNWALLCAILFCIACSGSSQTEPPPQEQYVSYKVSINVGAGATQTVTYTWDVNFGANNSLLTTLTQPNGTNKTIQATIRMLASATEMTVPVKWKLTSCSGGSSWAEGANYQYWLQATAVSSGIVIEPAEQQRVGPFVGWTIGTVKGLSFKIKKGTSTQCTLTVQASPTVGGTVAVSPNSTQFEFGTVVTLTATPAPGHLFINWTGDATGTANPTTVTMNGNKTVTANFNSLTGYEYFAYVANDYLSSVSAYRIDPASGDLTEIAGSPFAAGTNPWDVAVDPTGKFAYVTESNNEVRGYTINPVTGALTAMTGSPFGPCYSPTSVAIDATGKFAYVANYWTNTVSAYAINSITGALSPIAGSPFAAGSGPQSLTVDPAGKFVYVANQGGTVSAYAINPATGALIEITGSPFAAGTNPFSVEVDPIGKFAYVANANSYTISAYSVNSATGALTEITGSPFPGGHNPLSIAVDPTGEFAYAASGSYVIPYAIDSATGALTEMTGSHYASGATRISIATIGIKQ